MTVDDESASMKKELTALREQLVNKSLQLKVGGTNFMWKCEPQMSFLRGAKHYKLHMALVVGIWIF